MSILCQKKKKVFNKPAVNCFTRLIFHQVFSVAAAAAEDDDDDANVHQSLFRISFSISYFQYLKM